MISNEELEQVIREKKSAENELTNEQIEKNVIEWTDFFRKNLDIFNEDYLGIKFSFFQKQRINTMADNEVSIVISSRGSAKSFDVASTAYDFALLYSNCTILITSMTLSQSNNIINEKMDKIFATEGTKWSSPILCQLRKDGWIKFKKDDTTSACYVEFSNGSKVFAVNCGDSARSKRANVVIIDEFVLTKKKDIDEIILPTLEVRKFGGRPEDYPEETKQIFLSSAKNKTNWGWNQLRKCVNGHYKDRTIKYGFFTGDIFTAIANGIQTKKQYIQRKRDTDDISFQQEYLNIFLDNNENSIFKYEDFEELAKLNSVEAIGSDTNLNPLHDESVTIFLKNGYRIISTKSLFGQSLELEDLNDAKKPIYKAEIYHQFTEDLPVPKNKFYQEEDGSIFKMKDEVFYSKISTIIGKEIYNYLAERHKSVPVFTVPPTRNVASKQDKR